MKLGFYLFAEYVNMFISGVVMSTLFFGGYDIPFVNEAAGAYIQIWLAIIGFVVLMTKALFLFLYLYGYGGPFHVSVMTS